ncbi:MAG: hypothetical protein WCS01_03430 [bacterium]
MNTPRHAFRGELFWVSVGHGLLIGLLLGLSLYRGCEAPPDMNLPVELIVPEAGDDSAGAKSTPDEVKPAPDEVKPTPEPPPEKDDVPAPEAAKPEADKARPDIKKKPDVKKPEPRKNKIEVSKTLIKRNPKAGSGGSKTKLSREEIQRLLDRGAKTGRPTLSDAQLRTLLDSSTKFGGGVAYDAGKAVPGTRAPNPLPRLGPAHSNRHRRTRGARRTVPERGRLGGGEPVARRFG